jgi:cGMP-dependent protein kinase
MIMKLVKTFKDQCRVYFLGEYVLGLDLFDALRKLGTLSDRDTKFYTACLLLALEHLSERNIIHRDLKPENVILDEDGYTKIIDFGAAKIVSGRTFTILGTPHYMAPEIVLGKGYTFSTDIWSLG